MITFAQLELKNFKIEKNPFIIHQEQQIASMYIYTR